MQSLAADRRSWTIAGQRAFLASGEVHYFRLDPRDWRDRLRKARDCGLGCVATYTPWLMHEPEPGRFDFAGGLDLERFLELCAEEGLHCLVRPGPYQYSELVCDGLPRWLCADAELRARRLDGGEIRASSLSYLHPRFLAHTAAWFDRILPLIASHQVQHGGAVAAVQFDNELVGIHEWFGSYDWHPAATGVGREDGRWAAWLRAKHGSVAAANAAYGTTAASWGELRPLDRLGPEPTDGQRRLMRDSAGFYLDGIATYAATLAGWMRAAGITVPLVHNSPNPDSNQNFLETSARLGDGFVLGSDHYWTLGQGWAQNHPTPHYAARCAMSLAQLDALGHPPTVWEMPGGSCSDWPPVSGHDARLAYLLNLAWGMKGWNYYVFAGGVNRPGTGTTSDVYDYGAGVAPDGTVRELWHAQKAFHDFAARHGWLVGAEHAVDLRVGVVWEHLRSKAWSGGVHPFTDHDAWTMALRGLWMSAACAGPSPAFHLLGDTEVPTDLPLAVACGPSLPAAVQRRLVDFLDRGGRLLVAPMLPWLDEELRPCRILAERLGVPAGPPPLRSGGTHAVVDACGECTVPAGGGVWPPATPPGAAITAQERGAGAVGWEMALPGGGMAAVLGLAWHHSQHEHARMLANALGRLGLRRRLHGGDHRLWAVLRHDGRRCLLFALNLFTFPVTAQWTFAHPGDGSPCAPGAVTVPGASVMVWTPEDGWRTP